MKKNKYLTYLILITTLLSGCHSKDSEQILTDDAHIIEEMEPTAIDIMMIGDILVHEPVYYSGMKEDGTINYDHLFSNIEDEINESDIRIVNQETILGGTELGLSGYPCFNSPQEIGISEAEAGFNTILHATNHTLDKGTIAVYNTINFWKSNYPYINVLGINETEQDKDNIIIYQEDDFKVAILNYTYGTNGIKVPDDTPYLVNILDKERIKSDIEKAKNLADMVVVCPHWGTEYVYEPDNMQKEYTKLFYDLGVDVVIGTHPHVLEPVEVIKEDGNDHEMLVYYSLGNFISSQDAKPRMVGGLAKITLIKDYENDECYIEKYELQPVVTQLGEYTSYLLKDYNNELADQNRIKRYSGCSDFSYEYVNDLCVDILGEDYDKNELCLKKSLR